MKMRLTLSILLFISMLYINAQESRQQLKQTNEFDSSIKAPIKSENAANNKNDFPVVKHHNPHKATRRSAVLPGWGQAYNKEYWKIPIVYAAIGIPTYTFLYYNQWYKKTRKAYTIVVNKEYNRYDEIDPALISNRTGLPIDLNSLQNYRNEFRRNRDYSIVFFVIAWGLNVVDATVFGHLKEFDVTEDLSISVQPAFDIATNSPGLTFAFNWKNSSPKQWLIR
ncbi:DUF5683 domain-containing protein [Danxiaibacter flavus]|uniref:DUF5683 domain-containing protein n=1 Tax=Danxiaibacter flavus TaxID=3049108 RepID=A0ABV3ZAU8_9BACT|nr:DUF5683 domain-containing protein [Chitinophagaceae bacterium DXS]